MKKKMSTKGKKRVSKVLKQDVGIIGFIVLGIVGILICTFVSTWSNDAELALNTTETYNKWSV